MGGQAAQAVFEIIVSKEYAKVNNFKGSITVPAGVSTKVGDLVLDLCVEAHQGGVPKDADSII